ncbi:MAG: sigma-70 family RNA polymerase sigma factor [Planctomycetes bacterium]|nr:sigma-70 family RNA polymerase sigma factor [Planctomycetota bacterium]
MMDEASRELVLKASRGDAVAVDDLLQRHLSGLYAFVRLNSSELLRSKESHADLVQSTCRELLENLEGFEYRSENEFKRWLFAAALNKIRKRMRYYRAEKRDLAREVRTRQTTDSTTLDFAALYAGIGSPSDHALVSEQLDRIERIFETLTEEQRQVMTLVRIVGLSHSEVAEQLGLSVEAARKIYSRASARLILELKQA